MKSALLFILALFLVSSTATAQSNNGQYQAKVYNFEADTDATSNQTTAKITRVDRVPDSEYEAESDPESELGPQYGRPVPQQHLIKDFGWWIFRLLGAFGGIW